jgi:hypothetical protein
MLLPKGERRREGERDDVAPMVKRKSCRASNAAIQVQLLVGVLKSVCVDKSQYGERSVAMLKSETVESVLGL